MSPNFQMFLDDCRARPLSTTTVAFYRRVLDEFLAVMGSEVLRRATVRAFMARQTCSTNNLHAKRRILSGVVGFLEAEGLIEGFRDPQDPYTQTLLGAVPRRGWKPRRPRQRTLDPLEQEVR